MRPMVAATAAKIKTASHTEFLTVPTEKSAPDFQRKRPDLQRSPPDLQR